MTAALEHVPAPASEPATDAALGDLAAATGREPLLPGTRLWFITFLFWMGGLAGAAVWFLQLSDAGSSWALCAWILALMCFYLSLCNTFIALPTAWIVLLAAAPDYALVRQPLANIALVAALATLGTVMANLTEYYLLAWLLRFGLGARIRRTRVFTWAVRWFDRAPFQFLVLNAFIPLPDAMRWLAILRRYSRPRFAAAYFVGRGPRYVLFAGLSVLMSFSARQIALIQVGLIAAALVGRLIWRATRPAAAPATPVPAGASEA